MNVNAYLGEMYLRICKTCLLMPFFNGVYFLARKQCKNINNNQHPFCCRNKPQRIEKYLIKTDDCCIIDTIVKDRLNIANTPI